MAALRATSGMRRRKYGNPPACDTAAVGDRDR
jgi:hypothetical protein